MTRHRKEDPVLVAAWHGCCATASLGSLQVPLQVALLVVLAVALVFALLVALTVASVVALAFASVVALVAALAAPLLLSMSLPIMLCERLHMQLSVTTWLIVVVPPKQSILMEDCAKAVQFIGPFPSWQRH